MSDTLSMVLIDMSEMVDVAYYDDAEYEFYVDDLNRNIAINLQRDQNDELAQYETVGELIKEKQIACVAQVPGEPVRVGYLSKLHGLDEIKRKMQGAATRFYPTMEIEYIYCGDWFEVEMDTDAAWERAMQF